MQNNLTSCAKLIRGPNHTRQPYLIRCLLPCSFPNLTCFTNLTYNLNLTCYPNLTPSPNLTYSSLNLSDCPYTRSQPTRFNYRATGSTRCYLEKALALPFSLSSFFIHLIAFTQLLHSLRSYQTRLWSSGQQLQHRQELRLQPAY